MESNHRDVDLACRIEDPFLRRSVKTALHLRRYLPFYVFGTIWIVTLAAFPVIRSSGDNDKSSVGTNRTALGNGSGAATTDAGPGELAATDPGAASTATAGAAGTAGAPGGTTTAGGPKAAGQTAAGGGAAPAPGAAGPAPTAANSPGFARVASGKMRDGRDCAPGVRQVAMSSYATQCTAAFSGNNGGTTYDGVSGDKIRIVRREFPDSANSQAADRINASAGFASEADRKAARDVFVNHFKKTFETYGRQVELVDYESQNGDSTEEAQGRGREGACADATKIKKDLKAFAVFSGSGVFGECAAAQGMLVFQTGAYYPEVWFKKYHPYAWHYLMECERISYQLGEYVGKRLYNRNAKWAGEAAFQAQKRTFAVYVPDNDEYQHCVSIWKGEIAKYGAPKPTQYDYQLDLSRFADQAAQAAVRFKAAGASSVVLACDPYSVIFLTQAAAKQAYYPEWLLLGVAAQDTDNLGRLYDQTEVDGHMFGLSQLGATSKLIGPNSEPGKLYKALTGKEIVAGTTGEYFEYVQMFNMIQSAGPVITPQTIAEGTKGIPPGGAPEFPLGYWSYADGPNGAAGAGDHTMIDDSREIFWKGTVNGPDGKPGTFIETYNGKRFRNGEWPTEEPPVYP